MTLDPQSVRLTPARYLSSWDADLAAALAVADHDPATPVPSCPGWSLDDLLSHLASVYAHKAAGIRTGREPDDGSWATESPPGTTAAEWCRVEAATLRGMLAGRDPDEPAWTWWPPEQTIGFWQRRMAQETAVHRWDAQAAVGVPDPIDAALAVDGCDELLGWLTWDWDAMPQPEAHGQVVVVQTDGAAWRLQLEPTRVTVTPDDADEQLGVDAVLAGPPSDLLLNLWGRAEGAVGLEGDPGAVAVLRQRLAQASG